MIAKTLIALVALQHLYFLYLEMFLWTKPIGLKTFAMTAEKAEITAQLAGNQGLYNGFLAAGLIWSLLHPNADTATQLATFFLGCVLVAAAYGGYSVGGKILLLQGVPAALALLAVFLL